MMCALLIHCLFSPSFITVPFGPTHPGIVRHNDIRNMKEDRAYSRTNDPSGKSAEQSLIAHRWSYAPR